MKQKCNYTDPFLVPIVLYRYESWTFQRDGENKLAVFEIAIRKILKSSQYERDDE